VPDLHTSGSDKPVPQKIPPTVVSNLMTIDQTATYLQISRRTLERWRDELSVPYIVLPNGRTRFQRQELDAWIETRKRSPRRR